MSYNMFRAIVIGVAIVLVLGMGYCAKQVLFSGSSSTATAPATAQPAPVAPPSQAPQYVPSAPATVGASDHTVKAAVDNWLSNNSNRQGKMKLVDIMPNQPFKATAIRFPDNDAVKWSNDPSQWSQIKLDLNRDGKDDEKWLLKNGRTYKRERLDSSGRVTATDYF